MLQIVASFLRKALFNRYTPFLLVVWLYCYVVSKEFVLLGRNPQVLTEVPLLLLFYHVLLMPLRRHWSSAIAAGLPLLVAYAAHDYGYWVLGTVPELIDFATIDDLMQVPGWRLLTILALAVPTLLWLGFLDLPRFFRFIRSGRSPGAMWLRAGPVVEIIVLLLFGAFLATTIWAPNVVEWVGGKVAKNRVDWEPQQDIEKYGRWFMSIVRDAERRVVAESLKDYRSPEETGLLLREAVAVKVEKRNVHLILMESFIDPKRFRKYRFSRDPIAEEFRDLVGDKVNVSFAPAVGTGTARSEFEVLCGVPSLKIAHAVEFNVFSGAPTPCLPTILAGLGYRTLSSFPGTPRYYNLLRAYRGLGFHQSLFGEKWVHTGVPTIKGNGWKGELFDGALFEQNREAISDRVTDGIPIFNYVVTMYGHLPHFLDQRYQPMFITVKPKNSWVARMANQTYYRTQALAEHFSKLRELDPTALVIAVSDHLPPLLPSFRIYKVACRAPGCYATWGYEAEINGRRAEGKRENLLIVMDRGEFVKLSPVSHFDIPGIILSRLTDGAYCNRPDRCNFGSSLTEESRGEFLEAYKTIVGLASRPVEE